MVQVIVLNWRNYLGRGIDYVDRMLNMVDRNLSEPFDFCEITERDIAVSSREGWWVKLSLLELPTDPAETKLYLDLDTVICGPLDPLVALARTNKARLWMRDDFSYSIVHPRTDLDEAFRKTLGGVGTCQSSVMLWHRPPDLRGADNPLMAECHGDQNVITKLLWPHGIALIPNDWVKSYKYHPGELAPVVCFHGSPKNHEVMDDPLVKEFWR